MVGGVGGRPGNVHSTRTRGILRCFKCHVSEGQNSRVRCVGDINSIVAMGSRAPLGTMCIGSVLHEVKGWT